MQNTNPILIIEEDRLNAMTVRRAIQELGTANSIISKTNCEQALEYLRSHENETPCLVFVNIDTPETKGMEFLRTVMGEELLRDTPIVAISDSDLHLSSDEILRLGAFKYIVLPGDYLELVEALAEVEHLWSPAELSAAGHAGGSAEPPMPY